MLEMVGALGSAWEAGWRPLRDIVVASWDGEEQGLLGSTEWVELHRSWVMDNVVAYLNVDVGAIGSRFVVAAHPVLNDLIRDAAGRTLYDGKATVEDMWVGKKIGTLGSWSDYTAFLDHAGIPSIDMGFQTADPTKEGVWMYHSNYDSFAWMEKFGDPGFVAHTAMTRLWGRMVVGLAGAEVLPWGVEEFGAEMLGYLVVYEGENARVGFEVDGLKRDLRRFMKLGGKWDAAGSKLRKDIGALRNTISSGWRGGCGHKRLEAKRLWSELQRAHFWPLMRMRGWFNGMDS